MIDVYSIIDREMKARGIDHYKTTQEHIDVSKKDVLVKLNKYIYLFVGQELDTKDLEQRVELYCYSNYYSFTQRSLDKASVGMYQFFEGELSVITSQYDDTEGGTFVPYRLEFIRITPIYDAQ
ncbi:MAG: hypothetical protein IKP73_01125 [Bacteroidales bacterium]|nr:hypothetical protein [Bacteroidales bacterium]